MDAQKIQTIVGLVSALSSVVGGSLEQWAVLFNFNAMYDAQTLETIRAQYEDRIARREAEQATFGLPGGAVIESLNGPRFGGLPSYPELDAIPPVVPAVEDVPTPTDVDAPAEVDAPEPTVNNEVV